MSTNKQAEFTLPTKMARRRLLVGRLVLSVLCTNALLALVAAYLLSGSMAWVTRFQFGFLAWSGILFLASLVLAVPAITPIVFRLLKPQDETPVEMTETQKTNLSRKEREASRRRFMQMLLAATSVFMSGCSRLDESPSVQTVLSWFDRLNHKVGLMVDSNYRLARTYPRNAVQPEQMRPNGSVVTPDSRLIQTPPEEWQLVVGEAHLREGRMMKRHWVREYTMEQLRAMPALEQTVEHICVEGWSAICHWRGVHLPAFIRMHDLRPESRYVFFLCDDLLATANGHERYSVTFDLKQALHPQNVLAYEYNGEPLPLEHGAPVRLASPTNVGWKSAKFVRYVFFTNEDMGGFWEKQGYPRYYGF